MDKFLKYTLSIGKFLFTVFLVYLVFSAAFVPAIGIWQKIITMAILLVVLIPTIFVFYAKDQFIQNHRFKEAWKKIRILYIILLTLFFLILALSFWVKYEISKTALTDVMGHLSRFLTAGLVQSNNQNKNNEDFLKNNNKSEKSENANEVTDSTNYNKGYNLQPDTNILPNFNNQVEHLLAKAQLVEQQITELQNQENSDTSNPSLIQTEQVIEPINNPQNIEISETSIFKVIEDSEIIEDSDPSISSIFQVEQIEISKKNVHENEESIPSYPKILISEIQIAGQDDSKKEFVELYNPNFQDVDLTGWYLQRKTETGSNYSTHTSANLFEGKTIKANGYFLIARKGYPENIADVLTSNPLTENNTLVLKNPNREISDMVGWGPNCRDFEANPAENPLAGSSIGRKIIGRAMQDLDNNAIDFELSTPTPKSANIIWMPPPPQQPQSEPEPEPEPQIETEPEPQQENNSSNEEPKEATSSQKILINKIQTYGQDKDDQFVELYNPNETAVKLEGFALKKKTSTGSESNLVSKSAFAGEIPAGGFFLIVPQNYSGNKQYNLTYSGKTYSLAQKNNTVLLYDKNSELQDKVGFGEASDYEQSPFACPGEEQCIPKGKSIERKELGQDTDNNSQDFRVAE